MPNPMHDPRYAVLRKLLVELREQNGLTQVEVAQRLGRPQSYISKYERGERRLDLIELLDLAHAIEFDPVKLMDSLQSRVT